MATQQILFAETIAGMKKAFKRKAYESDSDSEVESFTNRGHKLQKRARFAHKGQLAPTAGPSAYKEAVDYAGVRRNILYRNPPLVDDEGYEILSDDDDDRVEDAELAAAELNPYSNILLDHILAPLTASTDLPHHPTLSKPFTSKTLDELIHQSCTLMRKENQSLWEVRHLWTSLCGDGVWMPCETMVGSNDIDLYSDEHVARFLQILSNGGGKGSPTVVVNGESNPHITKNSIGVTQNQLLDGTSADGDVSMADAAGAGEEEKGKEVTSTKEPTEEKAIGGESKQTDDKEGSTNTNTNGNGDAQSKENAKDAGQLSNAQKEQAGPLLASEADEASFVHPMFLPPASAKPDRNMGIPENEAEDIRRLLALYVQKQEEVTRGATRLHQGLLRAERLRSNVLHWAKAEAHCGPNRDMSDGEDWYDKEEWGLTEDLKKGQDEEEEDTTTTGKKTRNRRT
ncbi:rxt2-like protein [Pochonia chlamydosporia 170]|uniref:Rxt2-like protein n=1 Tax=Pochonia chlamydosporia 170 TaxID=1380566 RepID=A0A179G8Z8_METCM|nr:rxt2-like protein [Pochonia chlamydosporia 170]OAQ73853.1 rxt2-like protein [Pochonia chlamydosporia 170]